MSAKKIEWGKEIVQAGSDAAQLASDAGIPGVGLIARFADHFYQKHLRKRFEEFASSAELDPELLEKVVADENYSNCFYAILEAVRQTHSKIGLAALALIYREHWSDEPYLMAATQAFSGLTDKTLTAFLRLYESIPADQDYLTLGVQKSEESYFHDLYNEAVELIRRNVFVMSAGGSMHANGPIQAMKWDHTETYYRYCVQAVARLESKANS